MMAQSPSTALKPVTNQTGLKAESKICFCFPFSDHPFHVFTRKFLEPPNLIHFVKSKCTKSRKISRPWLKSHQFWRWSWYTCIPDFRPFFPCILFRMLEVPISWSFLVTGGPQLGLNQISSPETPLSLSFFGHPQGKPSATFNCGFVAWKIPPH